MPSGKTKSKTFYGKPGLQFLISLGILFGQFNPAMATPSFPQAQADYNSGKFSQALESFKVLSAAYPSNVLVHYYLALCHQNLGHMGQAKAEYQIVVNSRQPQLAPMAAKGLATISSARSGSSSSTSSPSISPETNTGVRVATAKVKKVLEFWAEWWGPCKTFAPVFGATKSKFSDIRFEELNVDDGATKELSAKYGVSGIPCVVFLDGSGNVLFKGGPQQSIEGFSAQIQQFR